MITGFYTGILGLILVCLILQIVVRRRKFKVGLGDGGIPELEQRIRAHANFTETVPFLLILLFILENYGVSEELLHSYGIAIIISRLLHIAGIYTSRNATFGRVAGTVLTCTLIAVGSLLALINFIS